MEGKTAVVYLTHSNAYYISLVIRLIYTENQRGGFYSGQLISCACHDIMIVSATVTVSNRLCLSVKPTGLRVRHASSDQRWTIDFAHMLHPMANVDLVVLSLLAEV